MVDIQKQFNWIKQIYGLQPFINGKPFRVAKRDSKGEPTIQKEFANTTIHWFPVTDCDMPHQVILFDFDRRCNCNNYSGVDSCKSCDRWAEMEEFIKENYGNFEKIEKYLTEQDIPFFKSEHGGRSPHIFLFFRVSSEALRKTNYHAIRELVARHILKECRIDPQTSGFDINSILQKRHLVRVPNPIPLGEIQFLEFSDEELEKIFLEYCTTTTQQEEVKGESNLSILLDGYTSLRVHPALDFVNNTCYFGIFLPVLDDGKNTEYETLCILTDKGELFPTDIASLQERKIALRYKPVSFERRISLDLIRNFTLNSTISIKPRELFEEIRGVYRHYIEFACEDAYTFFPLWTIGTFLHPLFRTYPYIYIGGIKDCGKTKTLTVIYCLAFNSIFSGNLSTSSIFRLIQNAKTTLLIDETEKLNNPERAEEFRNILLNGYKQGSKVYRTERNRKDRFEVNEFEPYSPKVIANIKGLEDILASRCVPFIMRRTLNKEIGNREIDLSDPIWQRVRDKLYFFTLKHWKEIEAIYGSLENETDLQNREWELWHPILAIAKFFGIDLYQQMIRLSEIKTNEQHIENVTETGEYLLVGTLLEIAGTDTYYKVKEIKDAMSGKFDEEQKWLKSEWIGRALKRLGFIEKRRIGTGVEYRITPNVVRDLAERLGISRPTQPTPPSQPTLITSERSESNEGSEGLIDNKLMDNGEVEESYPNGIPSHPNLKRVKSTEVKTKIRVKFTKTLPEGIIAPDLKTYGPYQAGEVADLPQDTAKILINQKLAEEIMKVG